MPSPTGIWTSRRPTASPPAASARSPIRPVIARLFSPFGSLPWYTFLWLWTALLVATLSGLAGVRPCRPRLPAGRTRALPRQCPPADRCRDRPRLPLAGHLVVRPADEGDPGCRPDLVRRAARVAKAGNRPGFHRRACRRVAPGRPGSLAAWLYDDILKTATGAPLDQFSIGIPLWMRLPAAAVLVAWGGRPIEPGRSRWRRPSACRSCGRPASRSWPPSGRSRPTALGLPRRT